MEHLENIESNKFSNTLMIKLTGRYYTHESLLKVIMDNFINKIHKKIIAKGEISIIDPFSGDGRLIIGFIESWIQKKMPPIKWNIELWDIYEFGHNVAKDKLDNLICQGVFLKYNLRVVDTFTYSTNHFNYFDVVITNPPWEVLKPDSRELKILTSNKKEEYINSLRIYDNKLSEIFPNSQPEKKFAGWGTNLSRVGLELTISILNAQGDGLIILPVSLWGDEQSKKIREIVFSETCIKEISFIPAEAKIFGKADVDSSILFFSKEDVRSNDFILSKYDKNINLMSLNELKYKQLFSTNSEYSISANTTTERVNLLNKMKEKFTSWQILEKEKSEAIWIGREVDETKIDNYLSECESGITFIRGRMIDRYEIRNTPSSKFNKENFTIPISVNYERIVWRDVSRSSQKRRIIATIIPANFIAGNSLGVCYYKNDDSKALRILLGIMNSLCFEFQLRNHLATGHISMSAIRKTHIPRKTELSTYNEIFRLVKLALKGDKESQLKLEIAVAVTVYCLSKKEFGIILDSFDKLSEQEKTNLLMNYPQKQQNGQ